MSIIYQPKGKAREYSPLAANFYTGCDHKCKYCYAPKIRFTNPEEYSKNIKPRKDVLALLKKETSKNKNNPTQVLFNFMHDPYSQCNEEYGITRKALEMFYENNIPVSILSKGGSRALTDIDIFKKFGDSIMVGATLTFDNNSDSLEWEPGASLPSERLNMLKVLHENDIRTWASFEPVISPEQSINLIKKSVDYVDVYKIGKINNYKGLDKNIDWSLFLSTCVDILRSNNKPFYIKHDLRQSAPGVKLYGNEVLHDEFVAKPFILDKGCLFNG